MALKDLVADRGKITEEAIERIVANYVRYDPTKLEIVLTPDGMALTNDIKVLVYLVATLGWEYVTDDAPLSDTRPAILETAIGIPGGSLRPILKKLRESHLLKVESGRYVVQPTNLDSIGRLVSGERLTSAPKRPVKKHAPSINSDVSAKRRPEARRTGQPIMGSLARLIEQGFFQEHRTLAEVVARLHEQAIIAKLTSLSGPLADLVRVGKLERRKLANQGKEVWAYKAT